MYMLNDGYAVVKRSARTREKVVSRQLRQGSSSPRKGGVIILQRKRLAKLNATSWEAPGLRENRRVYRYAIIEDAVQGWDEWLCAEVSLV